MFSYRLRFSLILLFIIIGLVLQVKLGFSSAWYLYLAALLLLFTHFRFGNVSAAFVKLRQGHPEHAEILLDQIKRPDWLAKRHRAYYHFTRGMIATQEEDLQEGEVELNKALELGLRSATDHALVALNLAHICFVGQRKEEARKYLDLAKSHPTNDLLIKEKVKELEQALITSQN